MLQANYAITSIINLIIETFIFINFMMMITSITAVTAQNQITTPLIITNNNNNLINSNNNSYGEDENELISYVTAIFCQLNSNPVYMYIDQEMEFSRTVGYMIRSINGCMRSTFLVKSINYTSSYEPQKLETNNKLNFTLFLIINRLSDRPDQQFSFISKNTADKNKKKFILFVNNNNNTENSFQQLFREFHRKLIFNILVVARNESTNFDVMTYNPFSESNYIERFNRNESRLTQLFYNKIYGNSDKPIQIKVILFEEHPRMEWSYTNHMFTGIDGYMMQTIMKNMNAEYEIKTPRDNKTYGAYMNGSMYGVLKDIQEWRGDVAFNSRFLKPGDYLTLVEPTLVFGRDDLCILVPNRGNQSHVGNLLHTFHYIIWILVVTMIFFVSWVMYFMQKITRRWKHSKLNYVLLTVFKANLYQSLGKTPKLFQMRIVLISWLFYSILITNAFIANLTSVLILEHELPQIDTLDDLARSELEILAVYRYRYDILRNLDNTKPNHELIANRIKQTEGSVLHRLIANNTVNYAYVEKNHVIKYILDLRSHLKKGRRIFHEMQQCPVPYFTTYITPIGSPYLDRINFLIRQLLESGLYNWWSKNLENEQRPSRRYRRYIKRRNNSEQPFKNLSIAHLQLVFYLLGFGLSLAAIVFLIELRITEKKRKQYTYKQLHDKIFKNVTKFVKNIKRN